MDELCLWLGLLVHSFLFVNTFSSRLTYSSCPIFFSQKNHVKYFWPFRSVVVRRCKKRTGACAVGFGFPFTFHTMTKTTWYDSEQSIISKGRNNSDDDDDHKKEDTCSFVITPSFFFCSLCLVSNNVCIIVGKNGNDIVIFKFATELWIIFWQMSDYVVITFQSFWLICL